MGYREEPARAMAGKDDRPIGKKERFERTVASLGIGGWRVREMAAGGVGPNMRAVLKGHRGTVEIWGGNHANEVWVIADGAETLIGIWHDVPELEELLGRACRMAAVQLRMAMP